MSENTLNISEMFYSVQAEGRNSGLPAVFIRLGNCSLNCGGPNGIWKQEGKATWHCDSEKIWKQFNTKDYTYIINKLIEYGVLDDVLDGSVIIVFTGGEPTLPNNQKDIVNFLEYLDKTYTDNNVYIEIETNGTQLINDDLFYRLNQINCSPKLSNSGNERERRINPQAIEKINKHKNSYFKLVISNENDILEFYEDFVHAVCPSINKNKIYLMPALDSREYFHDATKLVLELSKKYKCRACQRLHISAWDKLTGV